MTSRQRREPGDVRAPRGDRGLVGWVVAAVLAVVLTAGIPMTTSAFTATVVNPGNGATAKARFTCADTFAGQQRRQKAYFEFAFDEAAGATTARDSSDSGNPGTYQGANTKDTSSPTACPYDGGGAYQLDGSTSHVTTSKYYPPIRTSFSVEAWFKTTAPGKILGFQSTSDGSSSNYDKHLYVSRDGFLVYGVVDDTATRVRTMQSPKPVTDGVWHQAVGTTGPDGSALYLDGVKVDGDDAVIAENFSGYWRVGEGNLGGWPSVPDGDYNFVWFTGSIRFAAAYPYVLSADEVASEWSIGRPGAAPGGPDPTADPSASTTPQPTSSGSATAQPVSSASAIAVTGPGDDIPATSSPQEQPSASTAP